MSRSVTIAAAVCGLFAAGAVASWQRVHKLNGDAEWLMARGNAEAQQYADSFDSQHADAQLQSFDKRREVLEQAARWQGLELFCILGAVVSAFGAYVLYLYWRLRQQLVDATGAEDDSHHIAHAAPRPL